MKKNLRGKRYLRSRKSVAIGRQKRFEYKFNRMITVMNRIDWNSVVSNAVKVMTDVIRLAIETISKPVTNS